MPGMGQEADYDEFLALRRHVRKLQAGTPLLLRMQGHRGEDLDLQICTFQISQDLQLLTWRDCEGSAPAKQMPLSQIVSVEDASSPGSPGIPNGDGHHALQVGLRQEAGGSLPRSLQLICTSREDLEAWLQGLRFLIADLGAGEARPAQESDTGLQQKLKLQEQLCEQLRQENGMLRDIVKRKDATIAELMRDSQNKSIKTESTSRESDEHLQYREVAILNRKNRRLQKELNSKQQTIAGLLKLVERLSQQGDGETSAPEDTQDEPEINPKVSAPKVQITQVAVDPDQVSAAASAENPPVPCPSPLEVAGKADVQESEGFAGELVALVEKLQALQEATSTATQGVATLESQGGGGLSFKPPSRAAGAPTTTAPAAAAPFSSGGGTAGGGGAGGRGPKSAAALQALQKDMALLEEKKRVVQRLAQTLEPDPDPSDSEDSEKGDGFPLR